MQNHFLGLDIVEPIRRALDQAGFTEPTPIQADAIPPALAGRDVLGCAQTGSGKTAAFVVPTLQRLTVNRQRTAAGSPRALVLAPTRELAHQIGEVFHDLGRNLPLRRLVIYGGVGKQPQISSLRRGIDILVATPGRLLDLMGEGHITLQSVEVVILDEVDRMLDMGFIPDVKRIVAALPKRRQSLFFSATLPDAISGLAESMLQDPARVSIQSTAETTPSIDQRLLFVERDDKRALLQHLLTDSARSRTLVFTRTKYKARDLARQLSRGGLSADSLHGDKSQAARRKALEGFHSGKIRILVATDIASRGLDVDDIAHVINYELPHEPEVYVHRIGRTARAGKEGSAVSFCDSTEVKQLRDIERLLKAPVPVQEDHRYHSQEAAGLRQALERRTGAPAINTSGSRNGATQSVGQRQRRRRPQAQTQYAAAARRQGR